MHSARRTAAVLIALALATPLWAGDPNQEVFEKAYSMEGISRISVENVNGAARDQTRGGRPRR